MGYFDAQRQNIVQTMFVATADENYILARIAFQQKAMFDFLWLSLHALEKYFKAIRLLNGMSRNESHDIASLHAECVARFPGVITNKFSFSREEKKFWRKESVREFIVRLNVQGAAENRYATYGFSSFPDDLAKVDAAVWSIRRCCVNFESFSKFRNENHGEAESLDLIKKSPKRWMIGGQLPIELLVSSRGEEDVRKRFILGNKPWGADTWIVDQLRWASADSPFSNLIEYAQNGDREAQREAKRVLQWARKNIYFSASAANELDAALSQLDGPG